METLTHVIYGKTGSGKSTTHNNLFDLSWATDSSVACTTTGQYHDLDSSYFQNFNIPYKTVRVVDLPGIGEDLSSDEKYWTLYQQWIPQADSLLWIVQADTRAYKRDEIFLSKLLPLFSPSLFLTVGLNKIDCLGVDEEEEGFNFDTGNPSPAQLKGVKEKIDDIYNVFKSVIGDKLVFEKNQIVPYTATYGWGMEDLKAKIILRR